jgi:hypothetical protein
MLHRRCCSATCPVPRALLGSRRRCGRGIVPPLEQIVCCPPIRVVFGVTLFLSTSHLPLGVARTALTSNQLLQTWRLLFSCRGCISPTIGSI